jgi:hypothetical protein
VPKSKTLPIFQQKELSTGQKNEHTQNYSQEVDHKVSYDDGH